METVSELVAIHTALGEVQLSNSQYQKIIEASSAHAMTAEAYTAALLKLTQRIKHLEEKEVYLSDKNLELKPIVNSGEKLCRNSPCSCGSGLKFKKCCLPKHKVDTTVLERFLNSVKVKGEADAGTTD